MNLFPANNRTARTKNSGDNDILAWLRLARTEHVGPVSFFNFIEYYGSAQRALAILPERARRTGRAKPFVIPSEDDAARELDTVRKMGGDIICAFDPRYPLSLSAIEDAPPVIAVLGDAALLQKPCIAIVGARNASLNGRRFAGQLAAELGTGGQVVVSGLARGIDTAAHEAALETGTIAVVAGGIDIVYPPENEKLYRAIAEKGALIAENPPGMPPRARDFPRRNRIVSGLSSGVVVVEATDRSGSLITARLAGEQGRDVYAVPGHPLDPRAEGPNRLIREGAILARSAADILEGLATFAGSGLEDTARRAAQIPLAADIPETGEPDERDISEITKFLLARLSFTPCAIDDLIRDAGVDTGLAQAALLDLELAGYARRLPGNRVVLLQAEDPLAALAG